MFGLLFITSSGRLFTLQPYCELNYFHFVPLSTFISLHFTEKISEYLIFNVFTTKQISHKITGDPYPSLPTPERDCRSNKLKPEVTEDPPPPPPGESTVQEKQ